MSILSGYKKVKDRILTSSGYQLLSRWTSSNTVDFDDGKTAQTKVGAINGIIKDKNSLSTVTDDSFAAGAVAVKDAIADVNSKLSNISLNNVATGDGWLPTQKLNELSYTCVGRLIPEDTENIPDEYKTSWNAFVIALFGMGDKSKPYYPYNVGIQIITDMTGEHKTYKRVLHKTSGWSAWTVL